METRLDIYSDDYTTNKYALNFVRILSVALVVIWILNTLNIFIVDSRLMNLGVIGALSISCLAHIFSIFVGYERPSAKYIYLFFMSSLIIYTSVFLTYHTVLTMVFPIVFALLYRSRIVTAYTYILVFIGNILSVVLGYIIGLCDANMLLLTTSTTANQIDWLFNESIVINDNLPLLVLYYAIPRNILIAFVIPLLNYIARSITDKTLREMANKKKAETDGLTGLLNKNAFMEMAETAFHSGNSAPGALVFIDMDHFKNINDSLGHQIGDQAIVDCANSIREVFRNIDIAGRFGGDEFVVFIQQIPAEILEERLNSLLNKMRREYTSGEHTIPVSASIGAVYYETQPVISFSKLLNMADQQVYTVKDSGRDKVSIFTIKSVKH